jgi:hypothetical protein
MFIYRFFKYQKKLYIENQRLSAVDNIKLMRFNLSFSRNFKIKNSKRETKKRVKLNTYNI